MSRKSVVKSSTQSITVIALILGILVFVNILSYRMFHRVDLTENREYTVSESTKKILKNMNDIVNVTAYFSQDLPPYYSNIRTQISDILDEYEAFSDGNLNIEYIDPSNDEELKGKLARMGIPEVPLGEIKRDKQVISMGYLGISIEFGDNGEVIPFIRGISNLEYDLTSALLKVKDNTEKVIIWIGDQDMNQQDPASYQLLHDELNKSYVVRPMLPGTVSVIPTRTSLVVVDGSKELPERALFAIDQFMMKDGKVLFLTDSVVMNEGQGLSADTAEQSVHSLLKHYGIEVKPELVADARNAYAMFNSGFVRFRLPYPFWPKIGRDGFYPESPAVSQLESLVLPWTSPLSIMNDTENTEYIEMVKTSEQSWKTEKPFDLNPQQEWNVTEADLSRSVLAIEAKGNFGSYFKGKPVPAEPNPQGLPDEQEEEEIDESTDNGRFVVVASTRFANNQFLSLFPENLMFLQNVIDSLAIGNDLIGIRSRQVTDRPLDYGTTDEKEIESVKRFHRVVGTALIPILMVLFGLIRTIMQKRRKNSIIASK